MCGGGERSQHASSRAEHRLSHRQELTRRIHDAKRVQRKAELAHMLREEVEILVRCSAFDEGNIHCANCRTISGVRDKMATLILRTEKALSRTSKV